MRISRDKGYYLVFGGLNHASLLISNNNINIFNEELNQMTPSREHADGNITKWIQKLDLYCMWCIIRFVIWMFVLKNNNLCFSKWISFFPTLLILQVRLKSISTAQRSPSKGVANLYRVECQNFPIKVF